MNDVNAVTSPVARGKQGVGARKLKDITGLRFGRLTVLRRAGLNSVNQATWVCVCDCSPEKERVVAGVSLRGGKSKSCGCYQKEVAAQMRTHGFSGTPIYKCYMAMLNRCSVKTNSEWQHYGGRGITVCERWKTIENFMADMMPTWRADLSIERIDVNGNYEPSNCRWATNDEQQNNRRNNRFLTHNGETKTMAQWSRETGIREGTIHHRLDRGWSVAEALRVY